MRHHLRRLRHPLRDVVYFVFSVGLILGGTFFIWAASLKIPDVESVETRKVAQSTKIYDRTGTVLLYDLHPNIHRTIVAIEDISPKVRNATVAIEDSQFYQHSGIRLTAIMRAFLADIVPGGTTQGGSTITQQVVKNSVLTTDRTIARKLKEWVLAVKLEQVLSKDKILEIYLNESPYGGALYGVEAATEAFFGKHADDVTLAEAAYLAALPQAPTYFSPYGTHRTALDARKNLVLARMLAIGFITKDEYDDAFDDAVTFLPQSSGGIRAPHFVFYVREQLEHEFGERTLDQSGWKVVTSLDATMQEWAETTLTTFAAQNKEQFNASNAAAVALDPKNGDILAMVGSRDYFATDIDGAYNVTTALPGRQPGSAFKPFVYAQAFIDGYTPDTVLFDVPTQFSSECAPENLSNDAPCYAPQDYDEKWRGPMIIRDALAQSINIPAVKTLYLVGINNAIHLARAMGISTLTDAERYGLTLVLGGGEVTLLDMVSAYGVFANEGVRTPPRAILRIEDRTGNTVQSYDVAPRRVLDQNVALQISDILSDVTAKIPAYGVGSPIFFPGYHVASKTGTTNDTRDAWIIGYTPHLVIGTWAGNNDNSPMVKKVAGLIVVPMWHDFFAKALVGRADEPFPEPMDTTTEADKPVLRGVWEAGQVTRVDMSGNPVPETYTGPTKGKIVTDVHSILYWVDKKGDPRGPKPEYPGGDPQYPRWEYAVRQWASQHSIVDGVVIFR